MDAKALQSVESTKCMKLKNKYKVHAFVVSLPRLVDLVLRPGIVDCFFFFGGERLQFDEGHGTQDACEREQDRLLRGRYKHTRMA